MRPQENDRENTYDWKKIRSQELKQAITLVRCGELDVIKSGRLVDNPRLLELMVKIHAVAGKLPAPDLSVWPTGSLLEQTIFWLRSGAVIREYLHKRPQFGACITPLDDGDIEEMMTHLSALSSDPELATNDESRVNRIRLMRGAIRLLLLKIGEAYRLNENTGRELNEIISRTERLLEITDGVLQRDPHNSNYALKAEILYQKGRAERAKGFSFRAAEDSFTECLKLARKRLERYEGDQGQISGSLEYRHSAYIAAKTLLNLAYLAYIQGHLSRSRRLITAGWFVIYHCRDRWIKAEVQYMTAAIRRALTVDTVKLKAIGGVLEKADETLGELGVTREQQMVKAELLLTRIYLKDFDGADKIAREISDLAAHGGYWGARSKQLLAISYTHKYDDPLQVELKAESLDQALNYASAATDSFRRLPDYSSELVQALYVEAEVYIRIFTEKKEKAAFRKAVELLRRAESLNGLVERPPGYGEMSNQHNRGAITLLRSQLFLEGGDALSAEASLKIWEFEIGPHVETKWLHELANKLRERIPLHKRVFEVDINKTTDELYGEMVSEHFRLIKQHLIKSGQKAPDGKIARKMGMDLRTLQSYLEASEKQKRRAR